MTDVTVLASMLSFSYSRSNVVMYPFILGSRNCIDSSRILNFLFLSLSLSLTLCFCLILVYIILNPVSSLSNRLSSLIISMCVMCVNVCLLFHCSSGE